MLPVGLTPPLSVAVSEIAPPIVTATEAWVTTAGAAGVAESFSPASPQAPVAELFLASPP